MYEIFEKLLKERGVKTSVVARATGIDRSTFSHWKNDSYTPKADKMQKIADYFGVTVNYLMGWDEPELDRFNDERVQSIESMSATEIMKKALADTGYYDQEFTDEEVMDIIKYAHALLLMRGK